MVAAGVVALGLLVCVWSIWAWQYGGWFGTALYPGTVVLAAGLALMALFAPRRIRLRGAPAVAMAGLLALGAWSALSALWSPAPDMAIEDAQRILTYAMAFGLGIWLGALLGSRLHLAMVPLAVAGLFAGAIALGALLSGSEAAQLLHHGTLQYPIGYRNANAAFFGIAAWPALCLATSRDLAWPLRGVALGTATMCVELAALGQSRASILALATGLAVYVALNRDRARAVVWLVLAMVPAVVIIPALTDLYQAAEALARHELAREDFGPLIRAAGRAVALGAGLALLAGTFSALLERRFPLSPAVLRRANRIVGVGAIAIVVIGLIGFVSATGDPVEWVGDRADEFLGQDSLSSEGSSRFGFNATTERDDLWRVALDDAKDAPLLGAGGGSFYFSYLRGRSADGIESARDAHSVEFEFLGELGVVGLGALLLTLAAVTVGALRSRRLGLPSAALSVCALTAGSYWLTHASVDWFWPFPALTAPVIALLGSACAPAMVTTRSTKRGRGRWLIVAGALVLALSVVAPYMSERYVNQSYEIWRSDPERAFDDLDRAASLNPLSEEPLLAEGAIARASGDRDRAIRAFERAAERRPAEWVSHYFLAKLLAKQDPARSRRELGIAARQNPLSARVKAARKRLGYASPGPEGEDRPESR